MPRKESRASSGESRTASGRTDGKEKASRENEASDVESFQKEDEPEQRPFEEKLHGVMWTLKNSHIAGV